MRVVFQLFQRKPTVLLGAYRFLTHKTRFQTYETVPASSYLNEDRGPFRKHGIMPECTLHQRLRPLKKRHRRVRQRQPIAGVALQRQNGMVTSFSCTLNSLPVGTVILHLQDIFSFWSLFRHFGDTERAVKGEAAQDKNNSRGPFSGLLMFVTPRI